MYSYTRTVGVLQYRTIFDFQLQYLPKYLYNYDSNSRIIGLLGLLVLCKYSVQKKLNMNSEHKYKYSYMDDM